MEQSYKDYVRRRPEPILCSECDTRVSIKTYHRHLQSEHSISTSFKCVWHADYTWKCRDSQDHYGHRLSCLKDRIERDRDVSAMEISRDNTQELAVEENSITNVFGNNIAIDK